MTSYLILIAGELTRYIVLKLRVVEIYMTQNHIELLDCLVGGSRFLNEDEAIRVEDASIEIKDIINELYETL